MARYYYSDGSVLDYRNFEKKLHRIKGYAVKDDGTRQWWVNGERHRTDGPAIEWSDGEKFWYVNGKRHRIDGPASEWRNGDKQWFINGKEYTKEEYERQILIMQLSGLLDG
jgi:hypothetical protein